MFNTNVYCTIMGLVKYLKRLFIQKWQLLSFTHCHVAPKPDKSKKRCFEHCSCCTFPIFIFGWTIPLKISSILTNTKWFEIIITCAWNTLRCLLTFCMLVCVGQVAARTDGGTRRRTQGLSRSSSKRKSRFSSLWGLDTTSKKKTKGRLSINQVHIC